MAAQYSPSLVLVIVSCAPLPGHKLTYRLVTPSADVCPSQPHASAPPASNHVQTQHNHIPTSSTSHPSNPIPEEPEGVIEHESERQLLQGAALPLLSRSVSIDSTAYLSESSSDSDTPSTPRTDPQVLDLTERLDSELLLPAEDAPKPLARRRASTVLVSQSDEDVKRILGDEHGHTKLIEKVCCGGGCCQMQALEHDKASCYEPVITPNNDAFRSLQLELGPLSLNSKLTNVVDPPPQTITFSPVPPATTIPESTVEYHPPQFVTPHHPYTVYSSRIHHARELTRPSAEKRTYHFDLDVTDYPTEGGGVDFVVGGAIGVCAPNEAEVVNEIFDLLLVPRTVRDRPVVLKTKGSRWPTIWGDEQARELVTTRRELLTWCVDVQSYPPTKPLLRLLAEYATEANEKKILTFLSSAQGQGAFCNLRTGSYVTLIQLLRAFPSCTPSLPHLLCNLPTLMPRFYSLSNDPHISSSKVANEQCRLIEIAVTVHDTPEWRGSSRTGVGSGFLERAARIFMDAEKAGVPPSQINVRVPMFRGLMANPLAREFVSDGPMLLIGAGVGIAPFRGFVQRRLKNANCANKVWVLQGIRDSLLDELYRGEWGVHENELKKVVESRRGVGRYVQEEVRAQADLVWFIINSLDGRVFVCGSSKGMGEGVERALVDVAIDKGRLREEEAVEFWRKKKEDGQYIANSLYFIPETGNSTGNATSASPSLLITLIDRLIKVHDPEQLGKWGLETLLMRETGASAANLAAVGSGPNLATAVASGVAETASGVKVLQFLTLTHPKRSYISISTMPSSSSTASTTTPTTPQQPPAPPATVISIHPQCREEFLGVIRPKLAPLWAHFQTLDVTNGVGFAVASETDQLHVRLGELKGKYGLRGVVVEVSIVSSDAIATATAIEEGEKQGDEAAPKDDWEAGEATIRAFWESLGLKNGRAYIKVAGVGEGPASSRRLDLARQYCEMLKLRSP
ncbi:hypothetical protein GP486_001445 [Trichoglossum hirsutum]|uniref:FAD-binding FR-type domain-containing protein n=1 Tax=Trichoglossum hirsutum TaxID=265104 RepID=A0A9P8LH02_9PEZI|nr:hypothetical protein GP486_001445 [Trichoglossum hirsutum]